MINNNSSPTERTRHVHISYFSLQDWQQDGDFIMLHIPGIVNHSNPLFKPVGFLLHSQLLPSSYGLLLIYPDSK